VVQNLVFRLGCVFVDAAVFWKLWKSES
jgi:hypothetical protein